MNTPESGLKADGSAELTEEAKRAIDEYLARYGRRVFWAAGALGVTTIGGLVFSLLYVFLVLPAQAADRAFEAWDSKFSSYEEKIEAALESATNLRVKTEVSIEQVEEVKSRVLDIVDDVESLEHISQRLDETVGRISASDLARAAEIASSINAQTAADVIRTAEQARRDAQAASSLASELSAKLADAERVLREHVLVAGGVEGTGSAGVGEATDAVGSPVRQE